MDIRQRISYWTHSLTGRLLISMMAIHLLLLGVVFYTVLKLVENNYTEQFIDYVRTDNQRISELLTYELESGDEEQLTHFAENLLPTGRPVSIIIKNNTGQLIYPLNPQTQAPLIFHEDFFFGENGDNLYFISSILKGKNGEFLGSLQLAYDELPTQEEINALYRNGLLISAAYLLAVFFLIGIIDAYLTQPLRDLTSDANRIAEGRFDERFHVDSSVNEVKQLADSLELMRIELLERGEKLSDREQYLTALVDNIADAVIVCDLQGNIDSANQTATRIVEYVLDELLEKNLNQLISFEVIRQCVKRPACERLYETFVVHRSGSKIPVEINVSELQQGDKSLLLVVMRDISERKRSEFERQQYYSEMVHAGRLSIMGEMAAGLAHELNQPLAAISLYLQGCMRYCLPDKEKCREVYHAVKGADDQALRAAEIIRRIKNFARKEAKDENLELVDMNTLIRRSVEFVMLDKKYLVVQPELALAQWSLLTKVDALQIEQVLINLIRNALESMAGQPDNNMSLKIVSDINAKGHVQVSVIDSGEGVSEENFDKIFDTYFTTKTEGLGMGLAISRSIIEEHDGTLWCGYGRDRGSEFCFSLPLYND